MKISAMFYGATARSWLLGAAVAAGCLLATALVAQYGFGLHPCELCMAQRYPYVLVILAGLAGCFCMKSERGRQAALLLCGLFFWADAGIALYHAGVELGVFPGPSGCTNAAHGEQTLEEMRAAIMNAALVPCDQPMVHVLGLSMAAWNALAATLAAVLTFVKWGALRRVRMHGAR